MFDGEEADWGWGPVIEGYEPRTLHRGEIYEQDERVWMR